MRLPTDDVDRVPGGGWINPSGIPEPLASAIKSRERGRPKVGQITVTELLQPPRIRTLKARYWDNENMTFDVAHRVAAFVGSCVHDRLAHELYDQPGKKVERRLSMGCFGWQVSGQPDLYHELKWSDLDPEEQDSVLTTFTNVNPEVLKETPIGVIDDHKTAMSGRSMMFEKTDWRDQLDLYAHLYRDRGKTIHLARNLWLVCYMERYKMGVGNYPDRPAGKMLQALRSPEEAREFFEERVSLHRRTMLEDTPDTGLPECTESQRWQRPNSWAVVTRPMRRQGIEQAPKTRAKKVFWENDGETKKDAQEWMKLQKPPTKKGYRLAVEDRPGESIRCQPAYCQAFEFCATGKSLRRKVEERGNGEE
jgi:hypothetical protein